MKKFLSFCMAALLCFCAVNTDVYASNSSLVTPPHFLESGSNGSVIIPFNANFEVTLSGAAGSSSTGSQGGSGYTLKKVIRLSKGDTLRWETGSKGSLKTAGQISQGGGLSHLYVNDALVWTAGGGAGAVPTYSESSKSIVWSNVWVSGGEGVTNGASGSGRYHTHDVGDSNRKETQCGSMKISMGSHYITATKQAWDPECKQTNFWGYCDVSGSWVYVGHAPEGVDWDQWWYKQFLCTHEALNMSDFTYVNGHFEHTLIATKEAWDPECKQTNFWGYCSFADDWTYAGHAPEGVDWDQWWYKPYQCKHYLSGYTQEWINTCGYEQGSIYDYVAAKPGTCQFATGWMPDTQTLDCTGNGKFSIKLCDHAGLQYINTKVNLPYYLNDKCNLIILDDTVVYYKR